MSYRGTIGIPGAYIFKFSLNHLWILPYEYRLEINYRKFIVTMLSHALKTGGNGFPF